MLILRDPSCPSWFMNLGRDKKMLTWSISRQICYFESSHFRGRQSDPILQGSTSDNPGDLLRR